MQTSSGFPSPVRSVKVGDSLSVWSKILWRVQWVSLPFGFSNHEVSWPGKPMIRMSFQLSLLKSYANAKKLFEVLVVLSERALESRHSHTRHRPELQLERRRRRIVLVARLEVRPFPPPGPRDDVVHAVVVQVTIGGALAPELIAQLDPCEGMKLLCHGHCPG